VRRVLKSILLVLLVLILAFAGLISFLAATDAKPRRTHQWERLRNEPRPRGESAAALVGGCELIPQCAGRPPGQVFVVGGIAAFGRTVKDVDIYAVGQDKFSRGPDLPERRHHPAAAAIGTTVYVSGGAKNATNWKAERNLWGFTLGDPKWHPLPDMPEGRMAHRMVAIGNKLYVIGGRGGTKNVLIFDTVSEQWSVGAEMQVRRDHLGVAVVGTNIYAIGGRNAGLTRRVEIYETTSDSWTDGPPLPEPMSGMASGTLADGIHVVGGENPKTFGGGVIDEHFRLAPDATKWESAPLPILPVHGAASAVVSGNLVLFGGARRQGTLSVIAWTGLCQAFAPQQS
jgi:N-acetylneuraminic acid mutarotase